MLFTQKEHTCAQQYGRMQNIVKQNETVNIFYGLKAVEPISYSLVNHGFTVFVCLGGCMLSTQKGTHTRRIYITCIRENELGSGGYGYV